MKVRFRPNFLQCALRTAKHVPLWLSFDMVSAGYSPYSAKKVAFFVGLTENFGPVTEHTDIIFDRVITNVGGAYEQKTGRFTAPYDGVYQFNVIVSAQGRQKVAPPGELLLNGLYTLVASA